MPELLAQRFDTFPFSFIDPPAIRPREGVTGDNYATPSNQNSNAIVFGPDAIEIANDDNGRDDTDSLISVRLPLTGTYTIWVSSRNAGGKYVVRLVDAE